jgi:HSP20 family protein
MSLMRSDPFSEFDRLTERFFGQQAPARPSLMPMDAYRDGSTFVVHFDLPGVDPASLDVTVEKNVLTVDAERDWQPGEGQQVLASERPHGKFRRQLFLGENLDTEAVDANYEHGVLTLRIPVAEQAKPRRIEINAAANGKAIAASSSQS